MSDKLEAWLKSIDRAFGGDNATYEIKDTPPYKLVVSVGWALLTQYKISVSLDGVCIKTFDDERYVQPAEALARMGYEVHGLVDFFRS